MCNNNLLLAAAAAVAVAVAVVAVAAAAVASAATATAIFSSSLRFVHDTRARRLRVSTSRNNNL